MLAVPGLRNPKNEREGGEMEGFADFSGSSLLDSIDFEDLFLGISEGDVLPDLEVLESEARVPSHPDHQQLPAPSTPGDIQSSDKPTKPLPHSKNSHAKRKVKVDWTPELHRRFVQAVEQLGVDKAVPSRILELMGIHCLTRHNIASHLQKYRSHRKHLLAREAEAAGWSQRRQLYGKRDQLNPWSAATMGLAPPPHHFRPLHVWGHPSLDQSLMPIPIWPNPPPHAWPPAHAPPSPHPSFWIPHHHSQVPTPGTPCFPPHLPPARFPSPAPVPGIPPPGGIGFPTVASRQTLPHPPSDIHPSEESVDAAIGDVLLKPWLPLPLGLKPPSVDGVMVELQRQGISNVPPSCA